MNLNDVRYTYNFLGHKNQTEIRLIDPTGENKPKMFFVENFKEFVEICKKYEGIYNIYCGINERKPNGTKSEDVISINAFIIDIDTKKTNGSKASTIEEIYSAKKDAIRIKNWFVKHGRRPMLAFSGNGWQLWFKLDFVLNENNKYGVEDFMKKINKQIAEKFTSDTCIIDNISDLGRVIKVIGTKTFKINERGERVYRTSYWADKYISITPDLDWGQKILYYARLNFEKGYNEEIDDFCKEIDPNQFSFYMEKIRNKYKDIFEGKWQEHSYKSRSEAEFALLQHLKYLRIPPNYAWEIMNKSQIGKWKSAKKQYKLLTFRKIYGNNQ